MSWHSATIQSATIQSARTVAAAVDRLGAALLCGDVDAVLSQFASDGDILYSGSEAGEVAVGAVAVRRLLSELFARDERYCWSTDRVWVSAAGPVVHVVADTTLTVHPHGERGTGSAEEALAYRVTGVLEQSDDGERWRVCCGAELASPVPVGDNRSDPVAGAEAAR